MRMVELHGRPRQPFRQPRHHPRIPPPEGAHHQPARGYSWYRPAPPRQPAEAFRRSGRAEGRRRRLLRATLVRQRVAEDIGGRGVPRERALAAVVRLLDLSAIRIGNEHYARANDSYGATTLRADHAEVGKRKLDLHFVGKGGKEHELEVKDAGLAAAVRHMEDLDDAEDEDDGDGPPMPPVFAEAEGAVSRHLTMKKPPPPAIVEREVESMVEGWATMESACEVGP